MARRALARLGLGLLAAAIAFGAYSAGVLDSFEAKTVDARFAVRGQDRSEKQVVVIAIDEKTFSELKQLWPLKRRLHARAIRQLTRAGVKKIAYDVQFTEPTSAFDDNLLIESIIDSPGTVLSTTNVDDKGETAVLGGNAALREFGARAGITKLPADGNGVVREVPHSLEDLDSFSVATAEETTGKRIGDFGSALIDYRGGPKSIPTYSFIDLIQGRVPAAALRGKVAVVGATDVTLKDVFRTPTSGNKMMAGAEVQANGISTVLRDRPLRAAPGVIALAMILLFALLIPIASVFLKLRWSAAATVALVVGLGVAAVLLFNAGTVVVVLYPLLALALSTAATLGLDAWRSARERKRTRMLFSRFVPEAVVTELVERSGGAPLGGSRLYATVMFTDLRGFTRFAETRPADQVVDVLNFYLNGMSEAILDHDGTVVSFMGDGIMAVFGAPLERGDHADAAFDAAQEMLGERMERFNAWLAEQGIPPFRMGVGINTGDVMSGNIGSERRLEYAAIGDTTNVASRLETATKTVAGGLVLAQSTYELLTRNQSLLEPNESLEVKGREQAIETWVFARSPDEVATDVEPVKTAGAAR